MRRTSMRHFWDARAAENPYFFVDNRLDYGDPDLERFWAGGEEIVEQMLGQFGVGIAAGDDLVEIGCGVGRVTRALAARGARVQAIDVSARMLELARELNPDLEHVTWILGDGSTLAGIETASCDGCFSFVVFHHIPDPEVTMSYVREMGRVLRPGGWSAFQVSNAPSVHVRPLRDRIRARARWLALRGPGGTTNPAWLGSAVDLDRLREVAQQAGMGVERIEGAGTVYCAVLLRRRA